MRRRESLLALLAFAACAPSTFALKPGYKPPALLAVLPMYNQTPDLQGPDVVRYWFDQRLQEKKRYSTLPLERVDAGLRELRITEGGKLRAATPQIIGEKLGVDAVVYGDLIDFTYQPTGLLNVRKVKAEFRMVDCRTGETLWAGRGGANSEGATSGAAALQSGLKKATATLAETAANSPLRTEVWDMIWNAIEFLPDAR